MAFLARRLFSTAIAGAALASGLLTVGRTFAANDMFLQIDTVPGESLDTAFKNAIVVTSVGFGATNATTISSAGLTKGKSTVSVFRFSKAHDVSSNALLAKAAAGTRLTQVTLSVRKSGAAVASPVIYTIKLEGVVVTSVSQSQGGDDVPKDDVQMTFNKITIEYWKQRADGTLATPSFKTNWDVTTGTKSTM